MMGIVWVWKEMSFTKLVEKRRASSKFGKIWTLLKYFKNDGHDLILEKMNFLKLVQERRESSEFALNWTLLNYFKNDGHHLILEKWPLFPTCFAFGFLTTWKKTINKHTKYH